MGAGAPAVSGIGSIPNGMYCNSPSATMISLFSPSLPATGPTSIRLRFAGGRLEAAMARRKDTQPVIDLASRCLDQSPRRQLEAGHRAPVHYPEKAPLLAQRILQEQGLAAEESLDLSARGQGRLGERCVARVAAADLGFDASEILEHRADFFLGGTPVLLGRGASQQVGLPAFLGPQPHEESALAGAQARIDALAEVGARLLQQIEERAGAGAFVDFQRRSAMPFARLSPLEIHQEVDLELERVVFGGQK